MTGPPGTSFQDELNFFNQFLESWIKRYQKNIPTQAQQLVNALKYALGGGKRFRPLLVILTAKAFKQDLKSVLPYACAVELLHTYSLIHDDLPAMDNAEKRRGRLSLHKAFNEAIAILTGDALLTETFELAVFYKPKFLQDTSSLVQLLVQAAGGRGMVSGQILDLQAVDLQAADPQVVDLRITDPQAINWQKIDLEHLYELKTGALISASIIGAAMLSGARKSDILKLKSFARKLGIAFQIADDLEDFEEQSNDKSVINYVHQWGIQTAKKKLHEYLRQSLDILKSVKNTKDLQKLMRLHFNRSDNRL